MSEELDPALTRDHIKQSNNKMSRFAAQNSESIGDELEPQLTPYEHEGNNQLSKFKSTDQTEEDDCSD